MLYIKFMERSLYQFASNTKPLDTLARWNLGFTIVTSALEYVCQTREKSSTIAKFVVFCINNGFCINISIPMNEQNAKSILTCLCLHTGKCKRTGGCYNELVVAFYSTGGGVKGKKILSC